MNGETLTGLLKKGQMILAQAGIKEAGLDAWHMSQEKAGRIILHTEKKVSQKVLLKDIWN